MTQAMPQAMTQVVVVEFDEASRAMLHDILALDGHYPVTEFSDETAALAYLAAAPERVIAVVSNRDVHHQQSAAFFAAVVADEQLLTRHQYLMLSTNPLEMPAGLRANLTYLQATILAKPFELDTLLAAVREEATRLADPPPSPRARCAPPPATPDDRPAVRRQSEGPEADMKRPGSA